MWSMVVRRCSHQDKFIQLKATLISELAKPEHANTANLTTQRLWKVLLHFDRLLLAHPHDNQCTIGTTNRSLSQLITQRMDQYQRGQWAQLHNPTDPQPQPPTKTRTNQQLGKTITKLLNAGEVSRATALLNSPARFTTDSERIDDINDLHKQTTDAPQHESSSPK